MSTSGSGGRKLKRPDKTESGAAKAGGGAAGSGGIKSSRIISTNGKPRQR